MAVALKARPWACQFLAFSSFENNKPTSAKAGGSKRRLPAPRRQRTLLPAYAALLAKKPGGDVLADLAGVRGDR
jgi:hypothetical protein